VFVCRIVTSFLVENLAQIGFIFAKLGQFSDEQISNQISHWNLKSFKDIDLNRGQISNPNFLSNLKSSKANLKLNPNLSWQCHNMTVYNNLLANKRVHNMWMFSQLFMPAIHCQLLPSQLQLWLSINLRAIRHAQSPIGEEQPVKFSTLAEDAGMLRCRWKSDVTPGFESSTLF